MIATKEKFRMQILISVISILLICSIIWTYVSINQKPEAAEPKETSLVITPHYKVITTKDVKSWPAGTVFEQDMAAYFYATRPKINVTPVIETNGMGEGLLNGSIQLEAAIRAVNDKSMVYWSYLISKTSPQSFTISGSSPSKFTAPDFYIDVVDAYEQVTGISDELMFYNALYQLVITSNITLSGTVDGVPVEKNITQSLPLSLQQSSFSAPSAKDVASSFSIANQTLTQTPPSFFDLIGSNYIAFLLDLVLAALLIALIIKYNRANSKPSKEHKRYREWITEGIVDVNARHTINILSLEGLVDLAIDLDKRVIFDSAANKYYVLPEDNVYVYAPSQSQIKT